MSIPTPIFDKWFFLENGDFSEYLVVDSRYTSFFRGEEKEGYNQCRGITAKKQKHWQRVKLGVVLTDNTSSGGRPLREIAYSDVPADIKAIWRREMKKIEEFCAGEDEDYYREKGIDYWNVVNLSKNTAKSLASDKG